MSLYVFAFGIKKFLYIDPLKQGLKLHFLLIWFNIEIVFIHRSIKTRIETPLFAFFTSRPDRVFIHRSIKTRIETIFRQCLKISNYRVFIHRSIKTRIETSKNCNRLCKFNLFLYIDPLKQGLKHYCFFNFFNSIILFLYIDPLKQGLKP